MADEKYIDLDAKLRQAVTESGGNEWSVTYKKPAPPVVAEPVPAPAPAAEPEPLAPAVVQAAARADGPSDAEIIAVFKRGSMLELTEIASRCGIGALLAARGPTGMSPLHAVAYAPHVDGARVLIQLRHPLDCIETDTGNTPLHTAGMRGRVDLMDMFKLAGASETIRNREGKLASELLDKHADAHTAKKRFRMAADAVLAIARSNKTIGGIETDRVMPTIEYTASETDDNLLFAIQLADSMSKKLLAGAATTGWGLLALAASKIGLDAEALPLFSWCVRKDLAGKSMLHWLEMNNPLAQQVDSVETSVLLLRVRHAAYTLPAIGAPDSVAAHLLRQQLISDVLAAGGRLLSPLTIITLAALQLQLNYGDHKPETHNAGFLDTLIDKYLPRDMMGAELAALQALVFYAHRQLAGMGREAVNERIDSALSSIAMLGSTLYHCTIAANATTADDADVDVFVTARGLLFGSPKPSVFGAAYPRLTMLPWEKIKRWKAISTAVIVQTTADFGRAGTEQVLQFLCSTSSAMLQLMSDYYILYRELHTRLSLTLAPALPASSSLPHPGLMGAARRSGPPDPEGSRLQLFVRTFVAASRLPMGRPAPGSLLAQLYSSYFTGVPLRTLVVENARHSEAFLSAFKDTFAYVSPVALGEFVEDLAAVDVIDFSSCALGSNSGHDANKLKLLNECVPSMRALRLCQCNLAADAAMRLVHLVQALTPDFDLLDLSGNNLGPEAIADLLAALTKRRTRLRRLRLSSTGFADRNCEALIPLFSGQHDWNATRELDLSFNKITDKGLGDFLPCLERNRHIKLLDVSGCAVTERGLMDLMERLIGPNMSLEKLGIGSVKLTQRGADAVVRIGTNFGLAELDLTACDLSKKALTGMLEGLSATNRCTVHTLRLANNAIDKVFIGVLVHGLSVNLKQMCYLDLSCADIGKLWSELAEAIGHSRIEALSLANTSMSAKALAAFCTALNGNRVLRNLNLASNPKLTKDTGLAPLAALIMSGACAITNLLLMNCKLKDAHLGQIVHTLQIPTSLSALQLDDNGIEEDTIVSLLRTIDLSTHLKFARLDIRNNPGSLAPRVTAAVPLEHASCVVNIQ